MRLSLTRKQCGHGLGSSLEAVVSAQLRQALQLVSHRASEHAPEVVYDVRKACKRARAVVRLLHGAACAKPARALAKQIGDVLRSLSTLRDQQMPLGRLLDLEKSTRDRAERQAIEQLRAAWASERETGPAEAQCEQLSRDLEALLVQAIGLRIETGAEPIKRGLLRLMRRFRRAFRAATALLSTESCHRLRKRSKDLVYVLTLLRLILPHKFRRWRRRLKRISDVLGLEHDLFVLTEQLKAERLSSESIFALLADKWALRRVALQKRALRLSRPFATKPLRRIERQVHDVLRRRKAH